MEDVTPIKIRVTTREALKALKRGQQSYDDLLVEIIAFCRKNGFQNRKI